MQWWTSGVTKTIGHHCIIQIIQIIMIIIISNLLWISRNQSANMFKPKTLQMQLNDTYQCSVYRSYACNTQKSMMVFVVLWQHTGLLKSDSEEKNQSVWFENSCIAVRDDRSARNDSQNLQFVHNSVHNIGYEIDLCID